MSPPILVVDEKKLWLKEVIISMEHFPIVAATMYPWMYHRLYLQFIMYCTIVAVQMILRKNLNQLRNRMAYLVKKQQSYFCNMVRSLQSIARYDQYLI